MRKVGGKRICLLTTNNAPPNFQTKPVGMYRLLSVPGQIRL